ncbi:CLUMA_CG002001, isoform A [Clunio marinus]|uniref:CLUMA_CG002001, isoform A n=1 Tax=Clunio marinus TaxID=568069 RepID=A0A1J1HLC7_9DIPT|nr:CLUMA_CG002001, isoform A [Clunio marinus]
MKSSLIFCSFVIILLVVPSRSEELKDSTVAYVKASLPTQIYRCIQKFNLLRCLKYFVLLRLESGDFQDVKSDNDTSEFLGNILKEEGNMPQDIPESLLNLNEKELNQRLTDGFQKYFKHRPIMLKFIPNVLVKIVPSKTNDLEFSLKKFTESDFTGRDSPLTYEEDIEEQSDKTNEIKIEDTGSPNMKVPTEHEKIAMKKRDQYLQIGIPLVLIPAMIFAGFLPMLIPVLKIATAFTTVVNTFSLVAAILYLARQNALEKEMQQTVYFNPGYRNRK